MDLAVVAVEGGAIGFQVVVVGCEGGGSLVQFGLVWFFVVVVVVGLIFGWVLIVVMTSFDCGGW